MKHRLAILVAALLAQPLSAQQTDTVEITIYDQGDVRVEVTPLNYRGFRGDTLTFTGVVIDTITGDTLDAQLQWFTDSPGNVDIDAQTGHATFLNRGQYQVWAEVFRFTGFVVFRQRLDPVPGEFVEFMTAERAAYLKVPPDVNDIEVGESVKLCAYLLLEDVVVEKSEVTCPDVVLGNSDPLPSGGEAFRRYVDQQLGVMVGS